jgi:hypothetical protein
VFLAAGPMHSWDVIHQAMDASQRALLFLSRQPSLIIVSGKRNESATRNASSSALLYGV